MIKISIITPTYNNIEKLKDNINSVFNQLYKNIEHIIVDNKSNDSTDILIEDYKKKAKYPVVYIREKDSGIYNAMNKGIKIAKGEWIHILNADDCYYSNESLKLFIQGDIPKYDIIANSIIVRNTKFNEIYSKWNPEYKANINHYNFPHTGMIIKKSFYELNDYYNENYKIISDAIFCMNFLPKANYKIINTPLIIMSDSGVSNKISFRRSYELLIFTFFYYRGSIKYKVKFAYLNFFRDIILLLRILKRNIKNRYKKFSA
ncbi:hypothetical protein ES707_11737 [subsurface metagenome]